ncbi:hypothetical protein GCM10011588_03550 [Nocardia jinanensis]|uniref:Uncharacterized protein n=2 Tax=Nocardia jinanensis TaxID=382504 RepID=A0A917R6U3_9NOCA|nr:hypothetical protein GCM10011588_03550 [Nocardia jinanensis]
MRIARFVGAATACHGLAVAIRPAVLLRPCGWDDDHPGRRALARHHHLASGLGTALAPTPAALRIATGCRVFSDFSDAGAFATALRGRPERAKAAAVTAGWGLLRGAAGLTATRTP